MPHFYNSAENIVVSTNYKVMFSSLNLSETLTEITTKKLISLKFLSILKNHILIVRNPYERLKSFYRDKFIKFPSDIVDYPDSEWQHCHKILFRFLGIGKDNDKKQICTHLGNTSFSEFIEILPHCYQLDEHMHPQYWIKYLRADVKLPVFNFDRILKLESAKDMIFLSELAGLDLSSRHNSTAEIRCDTELTPESVSIINNIYKRDFREFGYKAINF